MAVLWTLGVDQHDPMLDEIRDYDDFPKSAEWIAAARARLLAAYEIRNL